jgi:hypothetical protein
MSPGLGDLYGGPTAPSLVTATVHNSPAAAGDDLFVVIPSYSPDDVWGPCPWAAHGASLPSAGDDALVGIDEEGNPWVLMWASA